MLFQRWVTTLFFVASTLHAMSASPVHAVDWNPGAVRTFLNEYGASVKGGFITPHWLGDDAFWYVDESDRAQPVFLIDLAAPAKTQLVSLAELIDTFSLSAATKALEYNAADAVLTVVSEDMQYAYDVTRKTLAKPKPYDAPVNPVVRSMFPMNRYDRRELASPDGAFVATLDGPDFVIETAQSRQTIVRTNDGTDLRQWFYGNDIWELSDDAWSPDSKRFVARSHDMSGITGIPIIDYLDAPDDVQRFRYWARAGEPLPITRFSVFDVDSGARVDIKTGGSPTQFAFFVRWLPDGQRFAFIRYTRDLSAQELVFADARTGDAKVVLKRSVEDGWVKWPSGPIGLHFLEGDKGFLWRSDENGYFHWYHHRMNGKRKRQVTHGDFDAGGIALVANNKVFFSAGSDPQHPYDQHLNVASLAGKGQRQLTRGEGRYRAVPTPDQSHFIVYHQSLTAPPSSMLLDAEGGIKLSLAKASVDAAFTRDWSAPEPFVAQTEDGKSDIHGVIYRPINFDPKKRYPVIERIYGGMQSLVTPRGYPGANMRGPGTEYGAMLAYFQSQGFVVVTMNSPGTPGRGRDYNLKTHGTWPNGIVSDHAAALRQIAASRPWMDLRRVGIDGNSWGGTLAAYAAAQAPDLYKAASLSVADVDLSDGIHWVEWHLGEEARNPAGYANGSAAQLAAQMKSQLMIVAGTSDVNVPISNTMKLLDGLAEAGKPYELVLFPGTNHAHTGRGDRYAYAINRIAQFFEKHLGTPQP
ncbi:MAG: prolyl oligopeptidase family serine peptidase [Pseudomonadota bacterium]